MADDEAGAELSRRVPGAARPGPGQSAQPVLSDSTLNRMQAAIDAERAQAEPEHLTTVPRYQDDPSTEPIAKVTSSGPPSSRRAKSGRTPSGTDAEAGVLPERPRKLEAVAEMPPDEEPLRVASALRAAQPEPVIVAQRDPVEAAEPPLLRAVEPPAHAVDPWAHAVDPPHAAEPPVRAVEPPAPAVQPPPVRAVEPSAPPVGAAPVRAVQPRAHPTEPWPVRAVAKQPPVPSEPPRPGASPAESVRPPRASNDPWWEAGTAASETGPTPGTVGWLWPDQSATRGGGGPRPPRRWRYRAATLVTLAAGALVGAGLFIGIALHSTPVAAGAHGNSTPKATARPAPSASTAPAAPIVDPTLGPDITSAVTWISQQLAPGTIVGCDAQTCAALTAAGMPASQQVLLGSASQSLSGASIVIVTPALRSLFDTNPDLGNYVAPTIMASFGEVTIQMIDPDGAAAYETELSDDVQARIQAGEALMNSGFISASATATSELEAGDVDSRLLLLLQALSLQEPIDILTFADSGPGASQGVPYRGVQLAEFDPNAGVSRSDYLQVFQQVLTAQSSFPPYQKAEPVTLSTGETVVQIQYALPLEFGLINPS
jgi:hypothetical protein